MEIICDTNIWYGLGNESIDCSIIKENDVLVATCISVYELCYTENYLYNFEYTKNAVRAMMKYSSKHPIIEPPFAYLKITCDKNYVYPINNEIFKFTEKIAQGCGIERADELKNEIEKRRQEIEKITDIFNEYVQTHIKPNIKNKDAHRKENSIPLNRNLINQLVATQTKSEGLNADFDWKRIELFENVLKLYFNEIEIGVKKIKPNDWFDLFLLIYVKPHRKIWTKDRNLKRLIEEVGLEEYLYEK